MNMVENMKSSKILLSVVVALCVLMSGSVHGTRIEEVGTTGIDSVYISIAIDANDGIHICFGDDAGNLIYATKTDAGWEKKVVDYVGNQLEHNSLAVDIHGNPCISYNVEDIGLKYATWTGNEWTIALIEYMETGYSSLAVNSEGTSHIAYADWTNNALKHAKWTGNSWQIETIESPDNDYKILRPPMLDIDSEDNPHIAYTYEEVVDRRLVSRSARYAHHNQSGWNTETIHEDNYLPASFHLDRHNRPNVILWSGEFIYAVKSDEGWEKNEIPSLSSRQPGYSLTINSRGEPSFYFYHYDQKDYLVKSATRVNGEWQTRELYTFSNSPNVVMVHAVDSNDGNHVLINDWLFDRLLYIYDDGSSDDGFPIQYMAAVVLVAVAATVAVAVLHHRRKKAAEPRPEEPPAGEGEHRDG